MTDPAEEARHGRLAGRHATFRSTRFGVLEKRFTFAAQYVKTTYTTNNFKAYVFRSKQKEGNL